MTQAELWQLQLLAVSNSIDGIGVLLTVLSGYLLAAYFVGHRLSRYQAALVSTFFVVGAGLGAFMTFVQLRRAFYFHRTTQLSIRRAELHAQYRNDLSRRDPVMPLSSGRLVLHVPDSEKSKSRRGPESNRFNPRAPLF